MIHENHLKVILTVDSYSIEIEEAKENWNKIPLHVLYSLFFSPSSL